MGLFGRKKDEQGLYTGDAPVSAPGFDGAEPGAYTGGQFRDSSVSAPPPVAAPGPYPAPGGPAPDYGMSHGSTTNPPGPSSPQDVLQGLPPRVQQVIGEFMTPQQGQRVVAGQGLDPATAARVQQQLSQAGRKVSKLGCLLIAIPILGALVGAGFAVYAAVHATSSVQDAIDGAISGLNSTAAAAPDGRDLGVTALGEPVSIQTEDASYDLTVFGAETQIGGGWGYVNAGDHQVLVVDAQITRTDTGAEPIEFTGWNWSVVGTDRKQVSGDIISHFAPSLDGPELIGGQSARGYVVFDTSLTTAILTVRDGPAGSALAAWQISATTPAMVDGVFDEPARAEISRPGFTVTIGAPEVITADDPRVGHPPTSGQYLAFPVTFAGVPGTSGNLGNVDKDAFVLKPDGAPAMFAEFSGVDGSFSFVSIDAAEPEQGYLAFDTAATSGRLELRNGADKPVITWTVTPG